MHLKHDHNVYELLKKLRGSASEHTQNKIQSKQSQTQSHTQQSEAQSKLNLNLNPNSNHPVI